VLAVFVPSSRPGGAYSHKGERKKEEDRKFNDEELNNSCTLSSVVRMMQSRIK
jgi:hypothetical protein